MLREGLELMIAGMAVVFCFLALLVAAMHVSALFLKGSGTSPSKAESSTNHAEAALAIAAVMRYRETGKG